MVLPNCLCFLKLFCIALRIPWLLDCWYSQTISFLSPLQLKCYIFYVTLKLCNFSLQTFLSYLCWPAHFLGLPCEMTLEKIALTTVAASCESRLKLLSRQIVVAVLPQLSLPRNYLIQTSVLQSSSTILSRAWMR